MPDALATGAGRAGGWCDRAWSATVDRTTTTDAGRSCALDVADRIDHLPGQHYVIRLTADDGYVAQRSYSIASAPADPLVEL